MSLIDEEGRPIAYGWNEEAVSERCKVDRGLKSIPDDQFEKLFPQLFRSTKTIKR